MNFFIAVLPIMKEYVCLFQSHEPLIHLLHDKQEQVFKDFMACFVKSENLVHKTAKQLKLLNLNSYEGQFHLPQTWQNCSRVPAESLYCLQHVR